MSFLPTSSSLPSSNLSEEQSSLLNQWANYLVGVSLIPGNQNSTDDFAGPLVNQTNLAIKGIIGIQAMAKIQEALGQSAQASTYSVGAWYGRCDQSVSLTTRDAHQTTATSYVNQWKTLSGFQSNQHLYLSVRQGSAH